MRTARHNKIKTPINTSIISSIELLEHPEIHRLAKHEFNANRAPLLRRIGENALFGAALAVVFVEVAKHTVKDETAQWKLLLSKNTSDKRLTSHVAKPQFSRLGNMAVRYGDKLLSKRRAAKGTAFNKTIHQFHFDHPEVLANEEIRYKAEVERKVRGIAGRQRVSIFNKVASKNANKLAYDIPSQQQINTSRFKSYVEFASATLDTAAKFSKDKAKLTLFSNDLENQQFADLKSKNAHMRNQVLDYNKGVPTLLWQMGFIEYVSDDPLASGVGTFNKDIMWTDDEDMVTARLPYDKTNNLHVQLGEIIQDNSANQRFIELQLSKDNSVSMNLAIATDVSALNTAA